MTISHFCTPACLHLIPSLFGGKPLWEGFGREEEIHLHLPTGEQTVPFLCTLAGGMAQPADTPDFEICKEGHTNAQRQQWTQVQQCPRTLEHHFPTSVPKGFNQFQPLLVLVPSLSILLEPSSGLQAICYPFKRLLSCLTLPKLVTKKPTMD